MAHAYASGLSPATGVNWGKAQEIGLALLVSPILGFSFAGAILYLSRRFAPSAVLHGPPAAEQSPPWPIRSLLVLTSSGVSFAHGSNDGQKGIGLLMLVLIAIMPAQFAVRSTATPTELHAAAESSARIAARLASEAPAQGADTIRTSAAAPVAAPLKLNGAAARPVAENLATVQDSLSRFDSLDVAGRLKLRAALLKTESGLSQLEKSSPALVSSPEWSTLQKDRKVLKGLTDYAPTWVILAVALSIGLGTMIGWKRIVVTLGSKIGRSHLTYAQGASAELVAMGMIGLSSAAGLPVSTTHVLSSGIAGTMVAGKAGVQGRTVKAILLAWVLTLPAAMALSAGLYLAFLRVFS
jgi:PiT family inorganic phosphate transporter